MRIDKAERLVRDCYCKCGKLRVPTPSGAVCEDHKLVLGVSEEDIRDAPVAKMLVENPKPKRVGGERSRTFEIAGRLFKTVRGLPRDMTCVIERSGKFEFVGLIERKTTRLCG